MSKDLRRIGYYCLINNFLVRSSVVLQPNVVFCKKFCAYPKKFMSSSLPHSSIGPSTGSPIISVDPKAHWNTLCTKLNFSKFIAESVWQVIEMRYGEEQRSYHNMHHIGALLRHSTKYAGLISDKEAVDLAIYFHDIVYDPKSKTNEEDSADLFVNLCSSHIDSTLCEKVKQYIIETKKHDVSRSQDNDLKLFIDMDMSILGVDPAQYEIYARQIRQEYAFVPEADYCRGRAAVLESFLQSPIAACEQPRNADLKESGPGQASKKCIFATEMCRELWEEQAGRNLAWECDILKSGRLV